VLYVTPRELAKALGVSSKTLEGWLAAGALPAPVRGKGPKGAQGWRRWPADEIARALREQGRPVPAAWSASAAA